MLWSIAFWRGATERALKTFAQALVAVIGVGAVGLLDVDWIGALSAALLATALHSLTVLDVDESEVTLRRSDREQRNVVLVAQLMELIEQWFDFTFEHFSTVESCQQRFLLVVHRHLS